MWPFIRPIYALMPIPEISMNDSCCDARRCLLKSRRKQPYLPWETTSCGHLSLAFGEASWLGEHADAREHASGSPPQTPAPSAVSAFDRVME